MAEANLLGAMTVTEVFLDQLRDGGGDLVNLSSVAGRTARPAITADDIAEVIAFAVTRPRRMTINEILVRPTAQP
jgi:NADP-dependent 3-hydroxy acid dehydrogenase YdfG